MSRGRFGLLLGLLVVVVATASFVGVLSLIDDEPGPAGTATSSSTTTGATGTTTTVPGGIVTPAFVVVVTSEADEASAQLLRDELTESGYDAGALRSDDYTSLEPGYWVAYVGPFPDAAAADAAKDELIAAGYSAAYTRCVGTAEQCA